jgi:hypothetical protein
MASAPPSSPPGSAAPAPAAPTHPVADDVVVETDVWIDAGDHRIPGTLAVPAAGAGEAGLTVLMLHGFASQRHEVGDMYGREARALAERGITSVRIDFAGTGDSGQPYTANTFTGMVADAAMAYDWLAAETGLTIGVLGFSMGAKVGLGLLAERPDTAAFASWSGALYDGLEFEQSEYEQAVADGSVVRDLGFAQVELSPEWFETMRDSTPLTDAAGYTGPIVAVAGSADTTVDPSISEDFVAALDSDDETLEIVDGADHIHNVLTDDQASADHVVQLTADWFAAHS